MSLVDNLNYLFEDNSSPEPAGQEAELEAGVHRAVVGGKSIAMLRATGIDICDSIELDCDSDEHLTTGYNGFGNLDFAGQNLAQSSTATKTSEFKWDFLGSHSPAKPITYTYDDDSSSDDSVDSEDEASSACSSDESTADTSGLENVVLDGASHNGQPKLPTAFFQSNPEILAEIFDEEPAILENCLSLDPSHLYNYLQAKPAVLRDFFEKNPNTLYYYLSNNVTKLGEFFQANPKFLEDLLDDECLAELVKYFEHKQSPSRAHDQNSCVAGAAIHNSESLQPAISNTSNNSPATKSNKPASVEVDSAMFGVYLSDSEDVQTKNGNQKSTIQPEQNADIQKNSKPSVDAEDEETDEDVISPRRRNNTKAQKIDSHHDTREQFGGKRPALNKKDEAAVDGTDTEDDYTTDNDIVDIDEEEYKNEDSDVDVTPARALVPYPAPRRLLSESRHHKPGKKWRLFEEDLAIGHMLDIRDENTIQGEDRFRETASRLLATNKIDRSQGAVKNFWNRTGRARSGFDERKNKKAPLATSQQGKNVKQKRKVAQTARNQELAGDAKPVAGTGHKNHARLSATPKKTKGHEPASARETPSKSSTPMSPTACKSPTEPFTPSLSKKKKSSPLPTPASTPGMAVKENSAEKSCTPEVKAADRITLEPKDLEKIIADAQVQANKMAEEKLSALFDQRFASMNAVPAPESQTPRSTGSSSKRKRSLDTEDELEEGQIHDEPSVKKHRATLTPADKIRNERYGQSPSERRAQHHEMTKAEKFYSDARRPSPTKREFDRQDRYDENNRESTRHRDVYHPRQNRRDRYDDRDDYHYRPSDHSRRSYDQGRRHGSRY